MTPNLAGISNPLQTTAWSVFKPLLLPSMNNLAPSRPKSMQGVSGSRCPQKRDQRALGMVLVTTVSGGEGGGVRYGKPASLADYRCKLPALLGL